MNKEQMNNYAYKLMVKNNPDEAVKNLLLKDKKIERLTNIVNKIEDMLQSPWNIECVNQNNEFLNKIKALKEGMSDE